MSPAAGWIGRLRNLFFDSREAEFVVALPHAQAVTRLHDAVRGPWAILHAGVVGWVGERRVSLRRNIPLVANSFAPQFVGRFERRAAGCVLTGHFRLPLVTRIFAVYVLLLCALFIAVGIVQAVQKPAEAWWLPLAGLGTMAFLIAMTAFGRWLARNDEAVITEAVERALRAHRSDRAEAR